MLEIQSRRLVTGCVVNAVFQIEPFVKKVDIQFVVDAYILAIVRRAVFHLQKALVPDDGLVARSPYGPPQQLRDAKELQPID
jgi:hypothetical protein